MARPASCRARLPLGLVALAAVSAAVAGCATAPSGGPPRPALGGSNQVQAYVQPLPAPGPTSKWSPTQVVLGFLHASASYAFDPAAARQYLAPSLRKNWHPGRGPVAVVGAPTSLSQQLYHPHEIGVPGLELVEYTGQHLATLSQSGQYQYAPGANVQYQFALARTNGVWLIQQLPQQQTLMLTESDFEEVYQPRNLFFFAAPPASQSPPELVPDPVYSTLQSSASALNTDLATRLASGLINGQGGWLAGASFSAFPAGTRLLRKVTITGKTAQVDLGGAAAHARPTAIQEMADQLLATLSDGEYSQPLASSLQLDINNKPQAVYRAGDLVPTVPSGPVQLITGTSSVGELPARPEHGARVQPRLSQAQLGSVTVTAVAASPDAAHPQQIAVAVQSAGGCAVEQQPGGQGAFKTYQLSSSGAACSSLSYDANGDLWAAAGGGVWLLGPGRSPVPVDMSAMSAAIKPSDHILGLRMAPDAVRAALLVSTPAGNRLLLAAVHVRSGSAWFGQPVTVGTTGLTDPQAISWYDPYHLAVLTTAGIYVVPLTGGAGQQPAPQLISTLPANTQAQTLTTDGTELVVGTNHGVYAEAASSPGDWTFLTNGMDPVYPG